MKPYVLRRLALAVPTLALVSVIVFSMMRLMPGDVVSRMVEGHAYAPTIEALRQGAGTRSAGVRPVLRVDRRNPPPRRLRRLVLDAPADPGRVRPALPRHHRAGGAHDPRVRGDRRPRRDRVRHSPGHRLRLRRPRPRHPRAVGALLRPRRPGGGAALHLLQVDAGVDLRAVHDGPSPEPQDHDRARARLRDHPRGADHAHHAVGAARGHAPGLHPHRVVEGTAGTGHRASPRAQERDDPGGDPRRSPDAAVHRRLRRSSRRSSGCPASGSSSSKR